METNEGWRAASVVIDSRSVFSPSSLLGGKNSKEKVGSVALARISSIRIVRIVRTGGTILLDPNGIVTVGGRARPADNRGRSPPAAPVRRGHALAGEARHARGIRRRGPAIP